MNYKVILNYALLFLISIGLTACGDSNDSGEILTFSDLATTFSGDTSGSINEDEASVSGNVLVTSPSGNVAFVAQTDVVLSFGSFSIDSSGQWTYTLDNTNNDIQALNAGDTATDTVRFDSTTGNTTNITITITGVNDDAVLAGTDTGSINSNDSAAVTGSLSLTGDVDEVPDSFVVQTDAATTYGTFTIDEEGAWSYTVDMSNADVMSLVPGATPLTDVIAVGTVDGLSTNVTITISGPAVNTPASFAGDLSGDISVGDTAAVIGTVMVTDPDLGENVTVAQSNVNQTYGTFTIGTDGAWSYILDNTNATVLALDPGATLMDEVSIASADGTMGAVTITINGPVPVATFAAALQNADMETYPTSESNNNDLVDAWTIDPDNSFNDGTPTPFNFWRNDALEGWVSTPANNGGTGTTDKGSSSGTDARSAGGTSNRSLKFDSSGERAYQPFEIETGVQYSISAFVKSETTPAGTVEGTFYILSDEPASDDELSSLALATQEVVSTDLNTWEQINFNFTASASFTFPQSRVDENTNDILTSTDQNFVIFYFVPTNTVMSDNEVFITDVVINTPGF